MAKNIKVRKPDPDIEVGADTVKHALINTFAKKPERVYASDLLKYMGIGGLLSAATAVIASEKKNKTQNGILAGIAGGSAGALTYLIKQNIMDQLDAYSSKDSRKQHPNKIETDPDAPPKTYVFYVKGAGRNLGKYKEPLKEIVYGADDVLNYKWGEVKDIIKDINKTRPQDKVILMGHSAGGGTALKVADEVNRPIDKLITLDPVQLHIDERIKEWFGMIKKPENVDIWENHVPENYDKPTWGNKLARLPFTLPSDIPGAHNVYYKDEDHSLYSIGLRPEEYRSIEGTFDFSKIAKRVRKSIDDLPTATKGVSFVKPSPA